MLESVKKTIKKNGLYVVIIILGVILIIVSNNISGNGHDSNTYNDGYCTMLEKKTADMLRTASGCENVKVMITFKNSTESEIMSNGSPISSGYFLSGAKDTEDKNIKTIKNPEIAGVMVVCKGINTHEDFSVIKKAVSTVLDTSENKIYIIGGN